jgi:hypothetical protein
VPVALEWGPAGESLMRDLLGVGFDELSLEAVTADLAVSSDNDAFWMIRNLLCF